MKSDEVWVNFLSPSSINSFLSYLKESTVDKYSAFLLLLKVFLISVSFWGGGFVCLRQYFYYSQKFAYVTVLGRKMIPKDVHVSIPEPVTILPHMAKMILLTWLRILTWGNYPVLADRPYSHKGLYKVKGGVRKMIIREGDDNKGRGAQS